MNYFVLYITAGNQEEAGEIAKKLVEERLAACANIIPRIESVYWWKGKVRNEKETLILAKTREGLVDRAIERVKGIHSYDVPCVVALPIAGGNEDYLKWVEEETG